MTAVFSRRSALGAGAVVLGVGVAVGAPAAATSAAVRDADPSAPEHDAPVAAVDPDRPVRALFAGREGEEYVASSPWREHRLILDRVDDIRGGADPEHSFRVQFTTDADARDGIYRILLGGELIASLFLARVSSEAILEGIVNRAEGSA